VFWALRVFIDVLKLHAFITNRTSKQNLTGSQINLPKHPHILLHRCSVHLSETLKLQKIASEGYRAMIFLETAEREQLKLNKTILGVQDLQGYSMHRRNLPVMGTK
jgi:hypothetical protein